VPRPPPKAPLSAAGTRSATGVPWYAILCLPILFAAGMLLFDTLDGTFMNFAYGWSPSQPLRKAYYNLTITGLSIAVAVIIGTVELLGLLRSPLGLHHGLLQSPRVAWCDLDPLDDVQNRVAATTA
jgi:nickel/cobalt transporter (NiCoT) family protein